MPNAVVVQYGTRADAAERNRGLMEGVFEELRGFRPGGFSYMAFRLEDGVGFVHVAVAEPTIRSRSQRPFAGSRKASVSV